MLKVKTLELFMFMKTPFDCNLNEKWTTILGIVKLTPIFVLAKVLVDSENEVQLSPEVSLVC